MTSHDTTIRDIQAELTTFSNLSEASGAEIVRNAITTLCKREQKVYIILDDARHRSDTTSVLEGERLLERVVETIARLIDVASKIAGGKPPGVAPSPPDVVGEVAKSETPGSSGSSSQLQLLPPAIPALPPSPVSPPLVIAAAAAGAPAASTGTDFASGTPSIVPGAAHAQIIRPPPGTDVSSPQQQQHAAAAASMPQRQGKRPTSSADALDGPPEISPEEVKYDPIRDLIGEGAFGKVYRATCRGKLVAVKVPTKQDLTEHQQRLFRHEVTIMRKVFHPNVVLFLGACSKPGKLMIVTELMKGDVEKLIHSSHRKLTLRQKLRIAHDAALGVNWLHGICSIVHRDLKPANLLLDENNRVHVTDFGFSEILRGHRGRDLRGPKGTALYMAPEVMRLEEYDQSADVHSFGLILYELATGREPFEAYTEIDPFVTALCYNNERPTIEPSEDTPPALVELMKACWAPEPSRRPTFPVIVETLVQLIVDTAMPEDSPARAFWKRHFLKPSLQEHVAWCDLEEIVAAATPAVPPAQIGKLESLIGVALSEFEPQRFITMERFQQFYSWFGKWFEPSGEPLLREMIEMVEALWFHGDISLDESAARLRFRENGTFLVRLSFKDPKTPFTISSMNSGQAVHRRVYRLTYDPRKPERFAVQLQDKGPFYKFPSLGKLVLALQQQGVLGSACPKDIIKVAY